MPRRPAKTVDHAVLQRKAHRVVDENIRGTLSYTEVCVCCNKVSVQREKIIIIRKQVCRVQYRVVCRIGRKIVSGVRTRPSRSHVGSM